MIQPLCPHNVVDSVGAIYGVIQPDNHEIVEKSKRNYSSIK